MSSRKALVVPILILAVGCSSTPDKNGAAAYQSQILQVKTVDELGQGPPPGGTVFPNAVLLKSSIDLSGNTHYQSVQVTLKQGSSAIVMCVAASSQFPQNAAPACVPTTPSFPAGAEIPNITAVPLPDRRVLIESKSGTITLGCKGQGLTSCEAYVSW